MTRRERRRGAGCVTPYEEYAAARAEPGGSLDAVARLVEAPWASLLHSDDPRLLGTGFEHALALPDAELTLADWGEAVIAESQHQTPFQLGLGARLLDWGQHLAGQPVDEAGRLLVHALVAASGKPTTPERLDAYFTRYGLNSDAGPVTLDAAARQLGLTRERFRQMQRDAEAARPDHELWVPGLRDAVLVSKRGRLGETALLDRLMTRGLLRQRLAVTSLNLLLNLAHYPEQIGVAAVDAEKVKLIRRTAAKLAGTPGVASVQQVASDSGSAEEDVRHVLAEMPDLAWVGESWFRGTGNQDRNKLRNTARRMIAAAGVPLTPDEVHVGLRRRMASRSQELRATVEMIAAFLSDHEEFCEGPTGYYDVVDQEAALATLGEVDTTMIEYLNSLPFRATSRIAFAEACVERGLNADTVSVYLSFNPILANYGKNIWGVVGVRLTPEVVLALQRAVPVEDAKTEHGWGSDGRYVITTRVTSQLLHTNVMSIRLRHMRGKRLTVLDQAGVEYGNVKFGDDHDFVHGWRDYLHAVRPAKGTWLRVQLDGVQDVATIEHHMTRPG